MPHILSQFFAPILHRKIGQPSVLFVPLRQLFPLAAKLLPEFRRLQHLNILPETQHPGQKVLPADELPLQQEPPVGLGDEGPLPVLLDEPPGRPGVKKGPKGPALPGEILPKVQLPLGDLPGPEPLLDRKSVV